MRVFVAGGTGVIGRQLIPALIADGHQVTATTRAAGNAASLAAAGARPAVLDGAPEGIVLRAAPGIWAPRYGSWRDGFREWARPAH